MPWANISDAPANIHRLDGAPLTLAQINSIARMADGIEGKNKPWAIAIAHFKKTNTVNGGKWAKKGTSEKELFIKELKEDLLSLIDEDAATIIEKNDKGTYDITTVSTAALEDREGETFSVEAMDYDIAEALKHGDYPEYRVFHSKHLGIGKVKKMMRVGIFAIDTGESYDDPFSLAVCEKMLANNDGRWRVSRGFKVHGLNGTCPECNNVLSISTKHMLGGFRCPGCNTVHLRFKGVLEGIQFTKARTFDVTVTDVPAVPYTGAHARRKDDKGVNGDISMNKKELKEKLIEAGISEGSIDDRLKEVTDDQLAQLGDIPMAEILKEFEADEDPDSNEGVVVEFDDMLAAFKEAVRSEIEEALDGFEVQIDGLNLEELKQEPVDLSELKGQISDLEGKVDQLLVEEEARLKHILKETSRNGKFRILRSKALHVNHDDDDDEEDEDDEEETNELMRKLGVKKETLKWISGLAPKVKKEEDTIVDASGAEFDNMTSMVHGTESEQP